MAKQYKLTKEKLEELQQELEYIKNVRENEVAEQIKVARGFGDLSENSEYDEAKNEQGKLYSRKAEIQAILDNYVLIDENAALDKGVSIGCEVTIELRGKEVTYTVVGSQEADPRKNCISDESPIGKAVMGHFAGDEVTVEAPAGSFPCKIISISR